MEQYKIYKHYKKLLNNSNRKQTSKIIKTEEFINSLINYNDYLNLLSDKNDIVFRVYKKQYKSTLNKYYFLFKNKDNIQLCKDFYIKSNLKLTKAHFNKYLPFLNYNEFTKEKNYELQGTSSRDKIIYFYDNISPSISTLQKQYPLLYNYFIQKSNPYYNTYSKRMYHFKDNVEYIMFNLFRIGKYKEGIRYGYDNAFNFREINLKILGFKSIDNLSLYQSAYKLQYGELKKCLYCNKVMKHQFYDISESKKFCSKKCQEENLYSKLKNRAIENNSNIIKYNTINSDITCNKCHKIFTRNTSNIFSKNMYTCNECSGIYSKGQLEIKDIITGSILEDTSLLYDKNKPFYSQERVDIYSKCYNFAVEYDGLMYHSHGISKSDTFNNPKPNINRHKNRMLQLLDNGVKLYRVWDIEWLNPIKKDIWVNMFNYKMGLNSKLGARKCTIKEVSVKEAREFLNKNHMQGFAGFEIAYGLYKDEKLYSIMTFGKSQRSKGKYELLRFCNLLGYTVQGAASRLLNHYVKNHKPDEIISYANLRWSQGDLYEKLGFDLSHEVQPTYYYFRNNYERTLKIFRRDKFTRSNIERYFNKGIYDITYWEPGSSEQENMYLNGYRKIYDCGLKCYIKKYNY